MRSWCSSACAAGRVRPMGRGLQLAQRRASTGSILTPHDRLKGRQWAFALVLFLRLFGLGRRTRRLLLLNLLSLHLLVRFDSGWEQRSLKRIRFRVQLVCKLQPSPVSLAR